MAPRSARRAAGQGEGREARRRGCGGEGAEEEKRYRELRGRRRGARHRG